MPCVLPRCLDSIIYGSTPFASYRTRRRIGQSKHRRREKFMATPSLLYRLMWEPTAIVDFLARTSLEIQHMPLLVPGRVVEKVLCTFEERQSVKRCTSRSLIGMILMLQ